MFILIMLLVMYLNEKKFEDIFDIMKVVCDEFVYF